MRKYLERNHYDSAFGVQATQISSGGIQRNLSFSYQLTSTFNSGKAEASRVWRSLLSALNHSLPYKSCTESVTHY